MNKPNIHVVRENRKWAIKRENDNRSTAEFDTQVEASECGRDLAKKDGVQFFLHEQDGSIELRDSYEHEPVD
jgi:hypothetical protein